MRRSLWVLGLVPFLLVGCGSGLPGSGSAADSCSISPDKRPAEVVTQAEVGQASTEQANVGLGLTSTLSGPIRVTVTFGDKRALDVKVPGTPQSCSHQPVYRYSYQLPPGQVLVTTTTDQGQTDETTMQLSSETRWLVVQVQKELSLQVSLSDDEPQWG